MLKLICFIHRHPKIDRLEFHRHWREEHGPLIKSLRPLRELVHRYEQNHRLESDYGRDQGALQAECDGSTIMWFRDWNHYQQFANHPLYEESIAKDEARFMDRSRTLYFFTHEAEVKIGNATRWDEVGVKLLALLKRRPGMQPSDFHDHWSGPHAGLFQNHASLCDQIMLYQQNHRTEEDYSRDLNTNWDGLAEQGYASLDAFYTGAGGAPFREIVVPDEERFIERSATRFLLCGPPETVI